MEWLAMMGEYPSTIIVTTIASSFPLDRTCRIICRRMPRITSSSTNRIMMFAAMLRSGYVERQYEAAFILSTIAATETEIVGNSETAIRALTDLMSHEIPEIRAMACLCLGNVAGHSLPFRDMLLSIPQLLSGM